MSTEADILTVRQYTNETDEGSEFTDVRITDIITTQDGDLRSAAGVIWSIKAAAYAELVDVTEGNSTRKLSALYRQAIAMSEHWSGVTDTGTVPDTGMRPGKTRAITRP